MSTGPGKRRWEQERCVIEMIDEPCYTFGSVDNVRRYDREIILEREHQLVSKHGLRCLVNEEPCGSAVLGTSGGATGLTEHSCVLLADRVLVAVGNRVAALALPELRLLWEAEGDQATCFGLHATPDERHVLVHGELAISKLTIDGGKLWAVFGRDILTGSFSLHDGVAVVSDWNGEEYRIDIERGRPLTSG